MPFKQTFNPVPKMYNRNAQTDRYFKLQSSLTTYNVSMEPIFCGCTILHVKFLIKFVLLTNLPNYFASCLLPPMSIHGQFNLRYHKEHPSNIQNAFKRIEQGPCPDFVLCLVVSGNIVGNISTADYKRTKSNLLADKKSICHLGLLFVWIIHLDLYIYYVLCIEILRY